MKKNIFFAVCSKVFLITALLTITACAITDVTSTTSGTVDAVTPDITLNEFVDLRLAQIQQEAANGKGENLDALAKLIGKTDKPAFSKWMKTNYQELFADLEQSSQLISRIESRSSHLI